MQCQPPKSVDLTASMTNPRLRWTFGQAQHLQCYRTEVPGSRRYAAPVKHDDVIVVPEFFCKEDDWNTYYTLIKDGKEVQQRWCMHFVMQHSLGVVEKLSGKQLCRKLA